METSRETDLVALNVSQPIWGRFYTVAPLVVIGTKEADGYDMAPKHMAMPLGRQNYYGFVCTPAHRTWHNVLREKVFTVSFPRPDQVTLASLAASPRCGDDQGPKPSLSGLPTFPAPNLDALLLGDCPLYLECELDRVVEGFGEFGLIAGKITGAHVRRESLKVTDGDDAALIRQCPLLAYLADGRFAAVADSFSFPFPKGFEDS